ncbi:TnpV protein [Enterocloster clostridioformis]|nr:TnpV protein [Lachnoclostridium sp. YL32]NDO30095.1 TnpV protein [Enterocloster clostridioformis]OXE67463.1 TnpV protein [Enterocloster clostridioformis]QQQ99215.1 TnpV protein [Enterocloster clostridioformis]
MKKTIFEEMGGIYIRHGDYLIPCLILPEEEENKVIGVWGQRHLRYLKEHKRLVYLNLLTSGRLNEYLASVNEQAEDMFSRLVKEYADRQGVTEHSKAENQLEWVGRMNNIQACVREIVNEEIIYV